MLDTAPTGHALRLLAMPETALDWVQALLAILLKYREVVGLGELAAELVATARRLRALRALLADPARARVVAVTRAAELPRRETERLLARLRRLGHRGAGRARQRADRRDLRALPAGAGDRAADPSPRRRSAGRAGGRGV